MNKKRLLAEEDVDLTGAYRLAEYPWYCSKCTDDDTVKCPHGYNYEFLEPHDEPAVLWYTATGDYLLEHEGGVVSNGFGGDGWKPSVYERLPLSRAAEFLAVCEPEAEAPIQTPDGRVHFGGGTGTACLTCHVLDYLPSVKAWLDKEAIKRHTVRDAKARIDPRSAQPPDDPRALLTTDEVHENVLSSCTPQVLDKWARECTPGPQDLQPLVLRVWSDTNFPEKQLGRDRWVALFRQANYSTDHLPTKMTLWRGATQRRKHGLSWSPDRHQAVWFSLQCPSARWAPTLPNRNHVWRMNNVPRRAVLCDISREPGAAARKFHSEKEVVLDPDYLSSHNIRDEGIIPIKLDADGPVVKSTVKVATKPKAASAAEPPPTMPEPAGPELSV